MNIDRLAVFRPHRALMHGLGRTDGHAMATVNAKVPAVFDGNGELPFGNQATRAGPDATTTANTETLVHFDHRL